MSTIKLNKKNIAILLLWIMPILLSISTEKFIIAETTNYIKYLYGGYLLTVFIIFKKLGIGLKEIDIKIFSLACLIYIPIILSDYANFLKWFYWFSYCLIVLIASRNYYGIIFSQYIKFCIIIFLLSILDLISYIIFNEMTVSINSIELVGFMPRINTIFDEMSHQAFFLMPALLYTAVNGNYKIAIPVFIAFIVTISASFLAALPIALISLGFIYRKDKSYYIAILGSAILFLIFSEFIISKMQYGYITDELEYLTFSPSIISIYISIILYSAIGYKTFLIGDGYFRDPFTFNQTEILYEIQNKFLLGDIVRLPAIFDLIYSYGVIILIPIILLIINIRKTTANKLIFDVCIFSILSFMFYNIHYVDYPVWIFIFFSLALSSPKIKT